MSTIAEIEAALPKLTTKELVLIELAIYSQFRQRGEVDSANYALREYGLSPSEIKKAEKRISTQLKASRTRGETTPFTGSADDFH